MSLDLKDGSGMSKKKVLIVFSSIFSSEKTGGIKTYIEQFINKFSQEYDITLLTITNKEKELAGVKVIDIAVTKKPLSLFFVFNTIKKLLNRTLQIDSKYDVVIYNRPEDALLSFFIKTEKNFLLIHGSIRYAYKFWSLPVAIISDLLERFVMVKMNKCFILLKNKQFGVSYYKKRYFYSKSKIEYTAVPLIAKNINTCISLHQRSDTLKLLYFGRLENNPKNIMLFPLIVKELLDKNQNVIFTIIGEGKDEERLKLLINSMDLNNHFEFLGHIEHSFLHERIEGQYDLSFILSDFEGICLSALESLYLKIPVCAFPVGDIPYYLENNQNGILLEANDDPFVIAEKIIYFRINNSQNNDKLLKTDEYFIDNAFDNLIKVIANE
jgi:glycosyltransferase involved in cell wall biosynthesis